MKKQFAPLLAVLATSLMLASCGTDTATTETTTTETTDSNMAMEGDAARMANPEGVMVDGVAMTADKNIVENAAAASSVSTLVAAVKQAGLAETLSGPGPLHRICAY